MTAATDPGANVARILELRAGAGRPERFVELRMTETEARNVWAWLNTMTRQLGIYASSKPELWAIELHATLDAILAPATEEAPR